MANENDGQMNFDDWDDEAKAFYKSRKEAKEKRKAERMANSGDSFETRDAWKPPFGEMFKDVIIESDTPDIVSSYNNHNLAIKLTLSDGTPYNFWIAMYPTDDDGEARMRKDGTKIRRQEYQEYLDLKEEVRDLLEISEEGNIFPFKCNFMRVKEPFSFTDKNGNERSGEKNALMVEPLNISIDEVQHELDSYN